jgi:signal transduction histidine kinase
VHGGDLLGASRVTLAAQAAQQRVSLSVQGAPGLAVRVDPGTVQRMLENLGANALRYTRQGDKVSLEASVEAGQLVLAVCNSGPPVPLSIRGRLFNKGVSSVENRHNAGLGLYFCRLVAEAHGGAIALEDRPGWSVAFVARLPVLEGPDGAARPA